MISIVQNGPFYEIRFPYNDALVSMVKQVPGRQWHPEDKFWSVPKDKVGFFLNLIRGTSFEQQLQIQSNEDLGVNTCLDVTSRYEIPDIDVSDVPQYVQKGGKLYRHQIDCLKYSIGRKERGNFNGFLLADEMGCLSGDAVVTIKIDKIYCTDVTLEKLYALVEDNSVSVDGLEVLSLDDVNQTFYPVRCVLNQGVKDCVCVTVDGIDDIVCTPNHEFLTDRGWVQAEDLVSSTNARYVRVALSDGSCGWKLVKSVCPVGVRSTYDIGIADHRVHWFVCNNAIVHNCGKTLEVINLALFKKKYEKAKHCLIICCVNAAKYNWAEDIEKHTNGEYEGYILGSRKQKRKGTVRLNGSGTEKFKDLETGYKYSDEKAAEPLPYFLILNVEALRTTDSTRKKAYRNVVTLKIVEMCLNGDITMIALDEIHRNASPQSEQGKQILKIKELTQNRVEWIPMTGTPIVNKPTDVFLPMRLVEAHHSNSYWMWNQHYCIYGGYGGHNVMGYKNIPELKSILEPNMLRRTKEQVLDLPDKVRHVEYVENSKVQMRLYQQVQDEIRSNIDEVFKSANSLGRLVKLRQVTGCPELVDETLDPRASNYLSVNSKMKRAVDLIQDIMDSGDKVVVFSNWIAPLRSLYRQLRKKKVNVVSYTGSMSQEEREANKSRFVNDPNCTVILGTVGALGTSHTLTVARNVVFFDEPWSMADLEQAEDRCHRVTSTGTVNVYSLITKGTVDEKVHNILMRKGAVSDFIVDNELNVRENTELLKFLLS